jgi:hypothetical protein
MKPNTYQLLRRCIEDGIERGWTRAHKHADSPDPSIVLDSIENAIMLEVHEWFLFDEVQE